VSEIEADQQAWPLDEPLYEGLRANVAVAAKVLNWEHESRKLLDVYRNLSCAS